MPAGLVGDSNQPGVVYTIVRRSRGQTTLLPGGLKRSTARGLFESGSPSWLALGTEVERVKIDRDLIQSVEVGLRATIPGSHNHFHLPLFIGADTPYRKVIVAAVANGEVLTYVKLPLTEEAVRRLSREGEALRSVSTGPLASRVPEVVGKIQTPLGEGLALTPVRGTKSPRRLGRVHAEWVSTLMGDSKMGSFVRTATWGSIDSRSQHVQEMLGGGGARHAEMLETTHDSLDSTLVPLGLAHGDFTTWNLRVGEGRLRAFDWEAAIFEAPPLYDLFYHAMVRQQSVLRPRGRWDRQVEKLVSRHWPALMQTYETLRDAYLLCVTNEFGKARSLQPSRRAGPLWTWLQAIFAGD